MSRPLRYPTDYPTSKPEEKGIDVQLAIDFVAGAIDGTYDVGIIASTDTDLVPAIDFVAGRFGGQRTVQVAAWSSGGYAPRIGSQSPRIWCHFLREADYEAIKDLTDYVKH